MKNKIAAFVDNNGNALPITAEGKIQVFEIRDSCWYCIDQFPFSIGGGTDVTEIRRRIHDIAPRLEGCIAIILHQCKGLLKAIFEEELRLRIFLATGNPIAVLFQVRDIIRTQIVQAIEQLEKKNNKSTIIVPVFIGEQVSGCYQIDLVKVQEQNPDLDYQEIILSFLQKEKFLELEIICLQKPEWLDKCLADFHLNTNTELRQDGFCHIFIRP